MKNLQIGLQTVETSWQKFTYIYMHIYKTFTFAIYGFLNGHIGLWQKNTIITITWHDKKESKTQTALINHIPYDANLFYLTQYLILFPTEI